MKMKEKERVGNKVGERTQHHTLGTLSGVGGSDRDRGGELSLNCL